MIIIGNFYKTNQDKIAYVSGGGSGMVRYSFNDGFGVRSINECATKDWEPLNIKEYPNSTDHALPYCFDLHWDVKYMSELIYMIFHKESIQGNEFDFDDAKMVLSWVNDQNDKMWNGYNITQKDFNRIKRSLKYSFGLVMKTN